MKKKRLRKPQAVANVVVSTSLRWNRPWQSFLLHRRFYFQDHQWRASTLIRTHIRWSDSPTTSYSIGGSWRRARNWRAFSWRTPRRGSVSGGGRVISVRPADPSPWSRIYLSHFRSRNQSRNRSTSRRPDRNRSRERNRNRSRSPARKVRNRSRRDDRRRRTRRLSA